MNTKYTIYFTIILIALLSVNVFAQVGVPPYPNAGDADVDGQITGDTPDWNLTIGSLDWFAHMYEGWNNNNKDRILSNLYLRYDCDNEIMYVLVYQATWDGTLIPILVQEADAWIAIGNTSNKVVLGSSGDDGTAPDFRWIDVGYDTDNTHARGYEASFPLTKNATYKIIAHANVLYSGGSATSGTEGQSTGLDLNVDCSVLPVELTSFSAIFMNNVAQLNWETATEVNNYGFEIQRSANELEWAKVGFVNGHGNSNSPKYYSFSDNNVIKSGKYFYRLKQMDIDGQFEYSDVVNVSFDMPDKEYKLNQNYPNPFNPSTTISYSLPEQTFVSIIVYNTFGEEVDRLVSDNKEAGIHSVTFNASKLASGMYYYKIETENYVATKKLLLLK